MPRTVLITGASSGIGLESAIWIARRGFRVVGTVRSEEKARAVQRVAAQARARVETVLLDVTDATEGARVIDDLEPYGLVNNAGYPAAGALEDVDDDEARLALETMVVAPMRLARLALRHMRARGEGRIVHVSSIFGCVAALDAAVHAAARQRRRGGRARDDRVPAPGPLPGRLRCPAAPAGGALRPDGGPGPRHAARARPVARQAASRSSASM